MTEEHEKQSGQDAEAVPPSEIEELKELLLRTQANFENYRKQVEKRVEELQQTAAKALIVQLLPVLDNFELALRNTQNQAEFVKGVELIYSLLVSILTAQGVTPITSEGQKYDPFIHEALLKVESSLSENTVIEEFQKGYLLHNRVLRHAKVKISANKVQIK